MKYEYYFCEFYKEKLEQYLCLKKIRYKKTESDITGNIIVFSIWSNNTDLDVIFSELEDLGVRKPFVFVSYSSAEINNAKWLVITPKKQSIDIINSELAYEYSCKWTSSMGVKKVNHEKQIAPFIIRKEPSTNTPTAFWSEDTGFSELFTDQRVYRLVKEHSLKGINFEKVKISKGFYSENIFQMKTSNIISNDCIEFGYGERKERCHICGKEQFYIDDIYQLHLKLSKLEIHSDLYMTERIWGGGIAYPLYIISQRFYQLLKQNKLVGGITLSPVIEIHN